MKNFRFFQSFLNHNEQHRQGSFGHQEGGVQEVPGEGWRPRTSHKVSCLSLWGRKPT